MKVILLEAVHGLGEAGELVNAKSGYARNYLLPRGLALEGTKANIEEWEVRVKENRRTRQRKRRSACPERKLEETKLELSVKAGEGGRLFGSITSQDICVALRDQGILVDRKKIELKTRLKKPARLPYRARLSRSDGGSHRQRHRGVIPVEERGRQLPHDFEAERSVLGAMVLDKEALHIGLARIDADDFYMQAYADVFRAISRLSAENVPIDTVTLANTLRKEGLWTRWAGSPP